MRLPRPAISNPPCSHEAEQHDSKWPTMTLIDTAGLVEMYHSEQLQLSVQELRILRHRCGIPPRRMARSSACRCVTSRHRPRHSANAVGQEVAAYGNVAHAARERKLRGLPCPPHRWRPGPSAGNRRENRHNCIVLLALPLLDSPPRPREITVAHSRTNVRTYADARIRQRTQTYTRLR